MFFILWCACLEQAIAHNSSFFSLSLLIPPSFPPSHIISYVHSTEVSEGEEGGDGVGVGETEKGGCEEADLYLCMFVCFSYRHVRMITASPSAYNTSLFRFLSSHLFFHPFPPHY